MKAMRNAFTVMIVSLLGGCVSLPENVEPVDDFELNRYLGTWYEIARLDHSFEKGMTRVTANYSLRDDGGVRVLNRGFVDEQTKWKDAEGKAYFVGEPDSGFLKVSFFGPFYGSYIVFGLDKDNYQHAFVSGPSTSYLWLLSRTPTVSEEIMEKFISMSKERGFDTDALILVEQ